MGLWGKRRRWIRLGVGQVASLLLLFLVVVGWCRVRSVQLRSRSSHNLKRIGVAFDSYLRANEDRFPADICNNKGKPLLSWRVAILPYLGHEELYRQFKLDEPWDSAHNKPLLAAMPKVYHLPSWRRTAPSPGMTFYQGFVGPSTVFERRPGQPLTHGMIADGTSNTILIVEAADSVPWTMPADLRYDPDGPLPPLGGHWLSDGYLILLADGSVRFISPQIPEEKVRDAIVYNDVHVIPVGW